MKKTIIAVAFASLTSFPVKAQLPAVEGFTFGKMITTRATTIPPLPPFPQYAAVKPRIPIFSNTVIVRKPVRLESFNGINRKVFVGKLPLPTKTNKVIVSERDFAVAGISPQLTENTNKQLLTIMLDMTLNQPVYFGETNIVICNVVAVTAIQVAGSGVMIEYTGDLTNWGFMAHWAKYDADQPVGLTWILPVDQDYPKLFFRAYKTDF